MPQSAIDSGCVDFVLSPEDIAGKIIQIARRPRAVRQTFPCSPSGGSSSGL